MLFLGLIICIVFVLESSGGGRIITSLFVIMTFHPYLDYLGMIIFITPYKRKVQQILLIKKASICKFLSKNLFLSNFLAPTQVSVNTQL